MKYINNWNQIKASVQNLNDSKVLLSGVQNSSYVNIDDNRSSLYDMNVSKSMIDQSKALNSILKNNRVKAEIR